MIDYYEITLPYINDAINNINIQNTHLKNTVNKYHPLST